jgi:uncharacterized protein YdeI (YjbR/CyaY-like superfamily)
LTGPPANFNTVCVESDLPKDFAGALKESGLAEFFSGCTGPHRREYLKWIAGAKRPETRRARILQAVKMLSDKRAEAAARAKKSA